MRRARSALASVALLLACGPGPKAPTDAPTGASPAPPYTLPLLNQAHIGSKAGAPDFHEARASLDGLHDGLFARATLVVDLGSPCFPFTGWSADPPPAGQQWPADCDAFDRNFEWSLVDPAHPDAPALELVRAITPFGGPLHLSVDVTDVLNAPAHGSVLRVFIPSSSDAAGKVTGSDGGWTVSARLDLEPGAPPRRVLAALPLLNLDATPAQPSGSARFELPDGTTSARLEYRATGHGGGQPSAGSDCIGPSEEFCRRTHQALADGASLDVWTPWRDDCDTLCTLTSVTTSTGQRLSYCAENPMGAVASVRAPRANWCPGSVTAARPFQPGVWATAGSHTFDFGIDRIDPGGRWRVSAVVFAYGE